MYASDTTTISIDVPLIYSSICRVNYLMFNRWWHVEVAYRIERHCSFWEADALESIVKGLKAIPLLCDDKIQRERIWRKIMQLYPRLSGHGWKIYTGYDRGVLSIVLTNSNNPTPMGKFRAVKISNPIQSALVTFDAWDDAFGVVVDQGGEAPPSRGTM